MGGVQGGMVGGQQLYGQAYLDALRQQQQATAQQASSSRQGTLVNSAGAITNSGGSYPSGDQGAYGGGTGAGTSGSGVGGTTGGQVYVQGPDGHLITQSAYEAELLAKQQAGASADQTRLQAQLQAEAEARRLASFSSFINTQPTVSRSTMQPDETAARAAAFGRAKDQAGQTAVASLKSLQDVMAGNGLTGSSVEGAGISDVVGKAAGGVNDFTREQYIQDLNREKDIQDQNFQSQVTQRGQTLSALPSMLGLITSSLKY